MEAHGTIGVREFDTINRNQRLYYRQVDIATQGGTGIRIPDRHPVS